MAKASASPAKGKKPRTTARAKGGAKLSPDLFIPRRKVGAPLKIVPLREGADQGQPLLQRALRDPSELVRAFQNRPPWVDDVAAITLIAFGLISLLALLNTSAVTSTALSDQWADMLSQLFGRFGAIILCLLLAGAGSLIALPRFGLTVHMPWQRVLGIEIAYLAMLAMLHLAANDPEPRALARSGQGGGYMGWALGEIMALLFGRLLSLFIYALIFTLAIVLIFALRRKHFRAALKAVSAWLDGVAERIRVYFDASRQNRQALRTEAQARIAARANAPALGDGTPRPAASDLDQTMLAAGAVPSEATVAVQPVPQVARRAASQPPPGDATIIAVPRREPTASPAAVAQGKTPAPIGPVRPAAATSSAPESPAVQPAPSPLRPAALHSSGMAASVPAAETETADADEPVRQPQPSAPVPIGVSRPSTSLPTAPASLAVAPRPSRYFTVDDFSDTRREIPREGLPPLTLLSETELNRPTEEEINNNVRIIENTLMEFDIDVEVIDVKVGPTVTQYAVQPFRELSGDEGSTVTQRVRVNKIASLASDLALALAAKRLRVQPYVPGHPYMGIEVPNRTPSIVALRPVMETEAFARAYLKPDPDDPSQKRQLPLVVPLGRDVSGDPVVVDLATMPHLLIAGTTGSGKSVAITAMITALVLNNMPDRVKLVLLDPKMVELARFNGLPHLLGPVETDIERIIGVLRWATREMDRRFKLLEVEAARNIEIYNRALGKRRQAEQLPYMLIFVDEIGDLMLSRPEEMERTVTRLAQMARAVGIHLVVATQRPSTDVITGLIKANFPARISFAVASGVDSRVILDTTGAESLVGRGDMLYQAPDAAVPRRIQGCFVSDDELDGIVAFWKEWQAAREATGEAQPLGVAPWELAITRRESLSEHEAMLEDAIDMAVREGEVSVALLQRRLGTTYPRAAQLMDLLQQLGILGATKDDGRTREVTLKPGSDPYKKLMAKYRRR